MARVQSILTYTVPAKCTTTPPPAPIRCGCEDMIIIMEDRSLIRTALHGILTVEIKSVAISAAPVDFVDGNGDSAKVWKFDYTIEYQDTDLTDAAYRIRRCDIRFNCCYSCGIAYTDRQLEGVVRSVGGLCVNNADPLNPVISPTIISGNIVTSVNACTYTVDQTLTRLRLVSGSLEYVDEANNTTTIALPTPTITSDSLVDNGNRTFTHTAANGAAVTFCQGVSFLDQGTGCESVGANFMVRSVNLDGCVLRITSAPEHTGVISAHGQESVNTPAPLTAVGQVRATGISTVTITNPSPCRIMIGYVTSKARMFGSLGVGDFTRLEFRLRTDPGTGTYVDTGKRRSFHQAGGPSNYSYDMDAVYLSPFAVPPGGTITFNAIAEVEMLSLNAGGNYTFDGNPESIVVELDAVGHTI